MDVTSYPPIYTDFDLVSVSKMGPRGCTRYHNSFGIQPFNFIIHSCALIIRIRTSCIWFLTGRTSCLWPILQCFIIQLYLSFSILYNTTLFYSSSTMYIRCEKIMTCARNEWNICAWNFPIYGNNVIKWLSSLQFPWYTSEISIQYVVLGVVNFISYFNNISFAITMLYW